MPRYRVTISGQGYEAMADLVRVHQIVVLHRTSRHKGRQRYTVEALADDGEGYHGTYNQGPYRPSCCLND